MDTWDKPKEFSKCSIWCAMLLPVEIQAIFLLHLIYNCGGKLLETLETLSENGHTSQPLIFEERVF